MTKREVATLFGVHYLTVHRWFKAGRLPAIKIGETVRFRRSDIDALISASKV